jgi:hypothetical protein
MEQALQAKEGSLKPSSVSTTVSGEQVAHIIWNRLKGGSGRNSVSFFGYTDLVEFVTVLSSLQCLIKAVRWAGETLDMCHVTRYNPLNDQVIC